LQDLALSIGENKTLHLKDITLLKGLQDIILLISISSFVQETAASSCVTVLKPEAVRQNKPIFVRNIQKSLLLYK
jgi:hypothetical protein